MTRLIEFGCFDFFGLGTDKAAALDALEAAVHIDFASGQTSPLPPPHGAATQREDETMTETDLAAENRRLRELLAHHGIDPAAGDTQAEHYKRLFALQGQARDLGRDIMSGGSGWRGSCYGAVRATYPQGSRVANEDSWRCHHDHPDDLSALECALGEVRRLAGGGSYEPCGTGPGCQDEFCRRDWARLTR